GIGFRLALPVLRKEPGDEELRSVRMRRMLEDCFGAEEHGQEIIGWGRQCHLPTFALNSKRAAHGGVEAREALAGTETASHPEMALDELRLLLHVLFHVAPAVFLDDVGEYEQRRVVVGRIGGYQFVRKFFLQEIDCRRR